ncbi:MAG: hypothetical protein HYR94_09060 [Chloroflexi bacterium]|nr:hypothetical protein [Chloroflexota bacterium]
MMLQPDVIRQLDLIAYEGWEYHKLALETLDLLGSSQANWDTKVIAGASFQGQIEGTHLNRNTSDPIATPVYYTRFRASA